MRKILAGLLLSLLSTFAFAQNGLENIIVEKYYVSNAADSVGSIGTLPVGSVTYRIYVDMLPGYKFQAAYGVAGHPLTLSTTTTFFNNEDRGATTPTYTKLQARGNTVMLDSWLSVGAACSGNFGILKSADDVAAGGATVINNTVPQILQNNDPTAGIAISVQDGLYLGSPQPVTFVGISSSDLAMLDATSQAGSIFTTSNGSWASLSGSTGPIASTNQVLIAQITTDGVFHFELNIQIGTPTGNTENYVAANPTAGEILLPALTQTLGAANASPLVSITSPSNGATFLANTSVPITANASDPDGSISSVEFFVDGIFLSTDNTAPYTANYTIVSGTHSITARATDNNNAQTTSTAISISVTSNPPPTCIITAPSNGSSFIIGDNISIAANATDNGSIASVEFFIDGIPLSTDLTFPYTASYIGVSGSHTITARATDNLGAQTTSAGILITVGSNPPPVVNITSPVQGDLFVAPTIVTITADATDANGSVTLVEFYVNGILVGSDATAPYSYAWASVIGTANITAKAIDNLNAHTTSAGVLITIADPNIPYKILNTVENCQPSSFCLPLTAISQVSNVIGYDMVVHFDNTKVFPTGVITVAGDLITPSFVDVAYAIDTPNSNMNISLFFNSSAPSGTRFNGTGDLLCIEFVKSGGFQSVDSTIVSVNSLQESYILGVANRTVDAGKYISYRDSLSSGSLKFWFDNSPIKYNASNPSQYIITNIFGNNLLCNGQSLTTSQPDTMGLFKYNFSQGENINIRKDIPGNISVQPVVNGFDALLTRKLLLNDPSFIPTIFQAIAMDVNMDGVISAGDVSQINQRAVLMIPEFKQAWNYDSLGNSNGQLSYDWLFVDSARILSNSAYQISAAFPSDDGIGFSKARVPVVPECLPVNVQNIATCPQFSSDSYTGILLGDVNGNYATALPNNTFRLTTGQKIIVDLSAAAYDHGYVFIPVSIESVRPVYSLDFALHLDENKYSYHGIVDNTVYIQSTSYRNSNDKVVRYSSFSINEYEVNSTLIYLKLTTESANLLVGDFSDFNGLLNGNSALVEIRKREEAYAGNLEDRILIYPNPANHTVNILLTANAYVQLFDVDGREVSPGRLFNANEKQEMNIENLANGVYFIKATSESASIIKKVIVKN